MATAYPFLKISSLQQFPGLQKKLTLQASQYQKVKLPSQLTIIKCLKARVQKQMVVQHLIIMVNENEEQKYEIIGRGVEQAMVITKSMLREQMGLIKRDKRVEDLDNIVNDKYVKKTNKKSISISSHNCIQLNTMVYFNYFPKTESFLLTSSQSLTFINFEQNCSQLPWLHSLSQQQQAQLKTKLSNSTITGKIKQDRNDIQFHLIINNQTGQTHNLEETLSFFQRLNIPYSQQLLSLGKKYQDYEDIMYHIQNIIEEVQNSWQLKHGRVRILNNGYIITEFLVKNNQLLLYQQMKQCIKQNKKFQSKGHYSKPYYSKIFKQYKENYSILQNINVEDTIKYIIYSQQMCLPLESVIKSKNKTKISKIHYSEFENSGINTFLVYFIIGPLGIQKREIINNLYKNVKDMENSAAVIKIDGYEGDEWNEVQRFMKGKDVFSKSKYAFLFIDWDYYVDVTYLIHQEISNICPQNNHYRIIHIAPHCSQSLSFYNEHLSKQINFPFSTNLILFCLRNIINRIQGYNPKHQPLKNISAAIHHLSFCFRNYKQITNSFCSRIIQINYNPSFSQISQSLKLSLQQLLQMSYKKEYSQNQHILHYFVSALQDLQIQQQPNISRICDDILMYSFKKLPYFDLS